MGGETPWLSKVTKTESYHFGTENEDIDEDKNEEAYAE